MRNQMPASQLSVQLYTVRRQFRADPGDTLARLAALGYRQVELFDPLGHACEYAAFLPSSGLTAPLIHALMNNPDDAEAIFALAERLGARTVIHPMIAPERWTSRSEVLAVAEDLNALVAPAAEHGLQIGYHNHWWELQQQVDGASALTLLADNLDEGVVLEIDTYWAQVGGADIVDLLTRLGDRVQFIHVKDGAVTLDPLDQAAVGSGQVDIPAVLGAAPQALRIVELDDFPGDIFDALRESFTYLTAHGVTP
jgi:sugar phosphate isomerase/epimerase